MLLLALLFSLAVAQSQCSTPELSLPDRVLLQYLNMTCGQNVTCVTVEADQSCVIVSIDTSVKFDNLGLLDTVQLPYVTRISGSVFVNAAKLKLFSLTGLQTVYGDLVIAGSATVQLPALAQVLGQFAATGSSTIDISSLTAVQTDFSISGSATVNASSLASVGGDVSVSSGQPQVSLAQLVRVHGGVIVSGITTMSFSLPLLQTVGGDLQLGANPYMRNFSFPKLLSVGGSLEVVGNGIGCDPSYPAVAALSFPGLVSVAGALNFTGNSNPQKYSVQTPGVGNYCSSRYGCASQNCGCPANYVYIGNCVCQFALTCTWLPVDLSGLESICKTASVSALQQELVYELCPAFVLPNRCGQLPPVSYVKPAGCPGAKIHIR